MATYITGMDFHQVDGFSIDGSERRETETGEVYYATTMHIIQGHNRVDITMYSKEILS